MVAPVCNRCPGTGYKPVPPFWHWLPAGTYPPGVDADLDYEGDVDLADFLIFQQNFTGSR